MVVKKGDKVKVDYTGTLEDGTVFDTSMHGDHSHPLDFEVGTGQVIKGFDDAVEGMGLNEEKEFTLQPSEAYGDHNPELVKKFPRAHIPPEAKEGMVLGMRLQNGAQIPATIVELNDHEATIDLNPPLAGKALTFKIKVVSID